MGLSFLLTFNLLINTYDHEQVHRGIAKLLIFLKILTIK